MPDTYLQAAVPLAPDEAFAIYVNQMDVWRPRPSGHLDTTQDDRRLTVDF